MTTISGLTQLVLDFRDARDWKQFHNPKDMALSLVLEAAEVAEHFQWKTDSEIESYLEGDGRTRLGHELADTLYWVLLMAHDLGIDLVKAFEDKIALNEAKYPVEVAKGRHLKYDKLCEEAKEK